MKHGTTTACSRLLTRANASSQTERPVVRLQFMKNSISDHLLNQLPEKRFKYVNLTLLSKGNRNQIQSDTYFIRYSSGSPKYEIRQISDIDPVKAIKVFKSIHIPTYVINTEIDMVNFIILGGNAIVKKSIARRFMPNLFRPQKCVPIGNEPGFQDINDISSSLLVKRPRKWLKKLAKERDNYECKLCGNKENISLHHILKREYGGQTKQTNLITVCIKCHDKIKFNNDYSLYELIGINPIQSSLNKKSFENSVNKYRENLGIYNEPNPAFKTDKTAPVP